jgi:TonB family protein
MILAKLSTRTNGNLLETAGMININASAEDGNCSLKQGQKIEISFPTKEEKESMQLYLGDWKSEHQINWEVVPESKDLNNVYNIPDIQPTFPGGQTQMMKFINTNIKYPKSALDKGIQGTVYLEFKVERDGKITNLKVLRGIDPECDQEALRVVKQFPKFSPAKSSDENVRTKFLLPIRFSLGDNVVETNEDYKKNFEKKYNEATVQTAEINELSRYIFTTTKLGWINCDRLWKNQNAPRIDYNVNIGEYNSSNVDIVFHSYKSIYSGLPLSKEFSFRNVPAGEDITIVAIKYMNNKPYLAIMESKTSSHTFKDLDFQAVTIETLKSKMKELDKLD